MRKSVKWAVLVALGLTLLSRQAEAQTTEVRLPSRATTLPTRVRIDTAAARRLPTRTMTVAESSVFLSVTDQPAGSRPQVTSRTAIGRARLERVLGGSSEPLRVVRADGVTNISRAADSVRIVPGEFIFRKMDDTAQLVVAGAVTPGVGPVAEGDGTYTMPYRWLSIDSAGVEQLLVPYFILVGGGLTYDAAARTYRGIALVGVEDTLHPNAGPVSLPLPLRMQLTTLSGGTVTPVQLAIAHTGLDYDSVRIESPDSNRVRIRTGADREGITIPLPVRAITVSMIPQQRSIQGFGLATTEISITLPRGMARAETAVVTFSTTKTPVRPGTIRVTGGEASTVRLRSGLPGSDTIRSYMDGVLVGETVVIFEPPWTFLSAALAGILLGGFARFFGAKRRKRATSLLWDILKGAPFGVLAAGAGAIGLDLLQLKLDDLASGTWIAVMITAAIGAWLGTRLFDRVAAPTT
ncbi:MAG: hypothetical protein ABR543_03810 [Gemmatimonadaceae bacterium]